MIIRLRQAAGLICAVAAMASSIGAANAFELQAPTKLPKRQRIEPTTYTPDLLIVMPNKGLKNDDLKETMEEVHGTVVGSLGEGDLKCYVIKTEKGHMEETEKKLLKDSKHFATVSRNYRISAKMVPQDGTNVEFKNQWHLQALHCPDAWNSATGTGVTVAVFDSGCAASNPDLAGKTDRGYDAYSAVAKAVGAAGGLLPGVALPGVTEVVGAVAGFADSVGGRGADADTDANSHGTVVATTIAGTMNNSFAGVGVAPNVRIYPVRIAENKSPLDKDHVYTTDLELIAGMINVMSKPNLRIVNISYNAPVVGFHNPLFHSALHVYFKKFFYEPLHSGLIFISAGNETCPDPTPPVPYLCVISGVDREGKLANTKSWGSNWGPAVTFTGPSVDIGCSDKTPRVQSTAGTSLSCPIVAAVAALILDKKPAAPNFEVLRTLIKSCKNIKGVPGFNMYYGWGMPDAYKAVTGNDPRPPALDGAPAASSNAPHVARRHKRVAAHP